MFLKKVVILGWKMTSKLGCINFKHYKMIFCDYRIFYDETKIFQDFIC